MENAVHISLGKVVFMEKHLFAGKSEFRHQLLRNFTNMHDEINKQDKTCNSGGILTTLIEKCHKNRILSFPMLFF